MIRNINKIISNNLMQDWLLKNIFHNNNRSLGTVLLSNSCSELSRFTPISDSQRAFSTCRHCNFIFYYQFSYKLNSLSSAVEMRNRPSYSSLLREYSKPHSIEESQKRFKYKKTQKRPEYDSDSDEENEEDEAMSKVGKPMKLRVQSLRVDGLLKKALAIARNKVETSFYEGSIRVNGTRPNKKSYQVQVGDEVDLIKGISPMNPNFLSISRVEVLSVTEDPDEEDELIVKIRRTKTMYVENYESDPWKKSSSSAE